MINPLIEPAGGREAFYAPKPIRPLADAMKVIDALMAQGPAVVAQHFARDDIRAIVNGIIGSHMASGADSTTSIRNAERLNAVGLIAQPQGGTPH